MKPPACRLTLVLVLTLPQLVLVAGAQEDSKDSKSDERLAEMYQRAEGIKVVCLQEDGDVEATLVPEPLLRYSDQPREIMDASLWCWEKEGRPVAIQKIEYYSKPDPSLTWFYCFSSLSPGLIDVNWPSGAAWQAKKPGVELQSLTALEAAKNKVARMLQMKRIAKRFAVRIEDQVSGTQEQMRLLVRPLHRYGKEKTELVDGAIFGFASNGTNSDALLLVEWNEKADYRGWRYGWVQMTTGELAATLDGKEVWRAPYRTFRPTSKFDSWLFFYESIFR